MNVFRRDVAATKSYADLEAVVQKVVGPSGLMEFIRFDLGSKNEEMTHARICVSSQAIRSS